MHLSTMNDRSQSDWLQLIRAEYTESPGLRLTKPQIRRLWNLDDALCEVLLDALQASHFLRRTESGTYAKVEVEN